LGVYVNENNETVTTFGETGKENGVTVAVFRRTSNGNNGTVSIFGGGQVM
jgi:hypothetical protein